MVEIINDIAYQTRPSKRVLADRIFAAAGVTAAEIPKSGVRIENGIASFDVRVRGIDGKFQVVDDQIVTRHVTIPVPAGATPDNEEERNAL